MKSSSMDKCIKANLPEGSEEECHKEIRIEQESNLSYNTFERSAGTNLSKSLKEEPLSTDHIGAQLLSEVEYDSKPRVSLLPNDGTTKCQTKRDYEQFLADSKPPIGSPIKRKGVRADVGDKQPTLFSYYGKK